MRRLVIVVTALLALVLGFWFTQAGAHPQQSDGPGYHLHLCIPGADRDEATCSWP